MPEMKVERGDLCPWTEIFVHSLLLPGWSPALFCRARGAPCAVGLCISFFVHSAFLFALAAALIKLEPLHSFFRRNLSGSKIQQFFPVTAHGAFESCPGRGDFTGKVMSIALCCKSASAIF